MFRVTFCNLEYLSSSWAADNVAKCWRVFMVVCERNWKNGDAILQGSHTEIVDAYDYYHS